ncbi:MAG: quinone-dependent dihydroorotate dehydrogenase [Bacteroidota bacterium]
MYKTLIKPLLFLMPAERAHYFTASIMRSVFTWPIFRNVLKSLYSKESPDLRKELFGLSFKNPVGLAAGFDKNAELFHMMDVLGFGFVEVGTVTPRPQGGNPQPRLFRLPKDEGLINRMGFNNGGVEAMKKRLQKKSRNLIVGVNIGKNKDTPLEKAVDDYVYCFEQLFDEADYFVVNVSSPNTPNLRALQDKEPLKNILSAICAINYKKQSPKPLLLKIAPDLSEGQLDDIIEISQDLKLDGLIATNTTISRDGLNTSSDRIEEIGNGGLSGKPVKRRSTEVIRYIHEKSKGAIRIIGVGGIQKGEDAKEKLEAGASLVQVYSGFVYEGPGMVKRILNELLN